MVDGRVARQPPPTGEGTPAGSPRPAKADEALCWKPCPIPTDRLRHLAGRRRPAARLLVAVDNTCHLRSRRRWSFGADSLVEQRCSTGYGDVLFGYGPVRVIHHGSPGAAWRKDGGAIPALRHGRPSLPGIPLSASERQAATAPARRGCVTAPASRDSATRPEAIHPPTVVAAADAALRLCGSSPAGRDHAADRARGWWTTPPVRRKRSPPSGADGSGDVAVPEGFHPVLVARRTTTGSPIKVALEPGQPPARTRSGTAHGIKQRHVLGTASTGRG